MVLAFFLNEEEAAILAREEDDSAEPRGLGEERTDVSSGVVSLAGTEFARARVHGGPEVASRGQRVPQPARGLQEREVQYIDGRKSRR